MSEDLYLFLIHKEYYYSSCDNWLNNYCKINQYDKY